MGQLVDYYVWLAQSEMVDQHRVAAVTRGLELREIAVAG
jgi:hypothetical protein